MEVLQVEKIEEQIARKYDFLENLEAWLANQGFSENFAQLLKVGISVGVIILLALLTDYIAKRIFLSTMQRVAKRTTSEWDDVLVEKKFFQHLAHFAPAAVIYFTVGIALYDYTPKITLIIQALAKIYMVIVGVLVFNSFFDSVNTIYQKLPFAKSRPIKGYLQVVKIILYVFAGIIIIGIIINRNPGTILVGLGASTAVLMLVFKDTIVGLVASIQLSANNMLKIGDWIEMPGRNIDGTVTDVSLTTIKVRNFDNTISTVPPYALVTESFRNWRGMEESDGRRMIRSIFIDAKTIKFCSPQLLEKLKEVSYCHDWVVEQDEDELKRANEDIAMLNKGIPTNLYLYRRYLEGYIKSHPEVNQELPLVVRLKQQVEYGIPVEMYCFLKDKSWVPYETTQSDIVDHALAALPVFELRTFQRMTSDDIRPTAGRS